MNTTIIIICFIITWVIILLLFIVSYYNTTERLRSIRHYVADIPDNYNYFKKIKEQYDNLTYHIINISKSIDEYINKAKNNEDVYDNCSHNAVQNNVNTASLKGSKSK